MARSGIGSLKKRPSDGTFVFGDTAGAAAELLKALPGYAPGAVLVVNDDGEPEFVGIPDADVELEVDEDGNPIPASPQEPAGDDDTSDPSSTPSESSDDAGEAPGGAPAPVESPIPGERDIPQDGSASSLEEEVHTQASIDQSIEEETPPAADASGEAASDEPTEETAKKSRRFGRNK